MHQCPFAISEAPTSCGYDTSDARKRIDGIPGPNLSPTHGRPLHRSHHFQVQMGLIRMLILVLHPPAARRASNMSVKMPTSPFVALDFESDAQTGQGGLGSGYHGLSIYRKSNALGLEPKCGSKNLLLEA